MVAPKLSLKGRALRYLSMREHSRIELTRKLARYVQDGDDVEKLLDTLEAANFLSQTRFSESLVHRRAARFGNNRILSELKTHGVIGEQLSAIKQTLVIDEVARARAVWQRKFGQSAVDAAQRAKQIRFLSQRGFSQQTIFKVLRGAGVDVDEDF
ncbi:MAG: recombination regulator RecX [Herbaspirillum sp.]